MDYFIVNEMGEVFLQFWVCPSANKYLAGCYVKGCICSKASHEKKNKAATSFSLMSISEDQLTSPLSLPGPFLHSIIAPDWSLVIPFFDKIICCSPWETKQRLISLWNFRAHMYNKHTWLCRASQVLSDAIPVMVFQGSVFDMADVSSNDWSLQSSLYKHHLSLQKLNIQHLK